MNIENKYKKIIISNGAEAFKKIITRTSIEERTYRTYLEHNLSERSFFWEGDDKLIITPHPISSEIFSKNKILMSFSNVFNISPGNIEISLSEAIINDDNLWNNLVNIIRDNPNIEISPYAYTDEFAQLIEKLKFENLNFSSNEIPKIGSEWVVSYLDSKSGFRSEMLKIQSKFDNPIIPEGFICTSLNESIKIAQWFYRRNKSCILKSDFGESGWGLLFVKKEKFISCSDIRKYIVEKIENDTIWDNSIVIVEEFIEPNKNEEYFSPSVEILVNDNQFQITYSCSQLLGKDGDFQGIILGKNSISENIKSQLYNISNAIGQRYFELGYKGYFDIDFIISSNMNLYAIETNTRRTGGTHVFDLAKYLFGSNWENDYHFLSQDSFVYGDKIQSINEIYSEISRVLFPIKNEQKGVIITKTNNMLPNIGFVIISPSPNESRKIYTELCRSFNKKTRDYN